MCYDSKRDGNLAAQKLFSAEHEARVEWQYCEIKSEVGAVLSFKRLAGVLRMVSGVKNETRHVTYIEQAEAIKLRDKLNEWFPSPDTRDKTDG